MDKYKVDMSYLYNIESDSLDDGDSVFVPSKE